MTTRGEMFAPLSEGDRAAGRSVAGKAKGKEDLRAIVPVPEDAPPMKWRHPKHGAPSRAWEYRTAEGGLVGFVARLDFRGEGGEPMKEYLPVSFVESANGRRSWRSKGFDVPRPLWNLPDLARRSEAPALVCEGEKAAEAAASHWPDLVAITPPHGARSPHLADWSAVKGRRVLVWPDADEPGRAFAANVARLALDAGAASVAVVTVPDDFPDGWDLADASPDGWNLERLRGLIDAAEPQTPPRRIGPFRLDGRGVWHVGDDGEAVFVCGPLEVLAHKRDAASRDWGYVLRFRDLDNRERREVLPRRAVFERTSDVAAWLADRGLPLGRGKHVRPLLSAYLAHADDTRGRVRSVARLGWHDAANGRPVFVLPDLTLGNPGAEDVSLDAGDDFEHAFREAGTLDEWREHVAARCVGNSRLVFAVSAAFAGPLLKLADAESGGVHYRGGSSVGKSTALEVAGSVWGGGGTRGYARTWRATDNGLEGVAAAHSDALLCLDELSEADSRTAAATAYMLANGRGKSRAGRRGEARAAASWRVFFLSTGEVSLGDKVREDGHKRATAGQEVRILDVPADAGAGLGLFEALHGAPSAKDFAEDLKAAAARYYGTASRRFLARLAGDADGVTTARGFVAETRKAFEREHAPAGADGQVLRGLGRFALVAAAGELARVLGVLPWPQGEATRAAAACFRVWLDARGGAEPAEVREGLARVRRFLVAHGSSRFETWGETEPRTLNRAGWKRADGADGWDYFIPSEVWREEVCVGLDARAVARLLADRGALVSGEDGRLARSLKIPGAGKIRVHHLRGALVHGDAATASEADAA